jgi:hypothetical protein
MDLEQVVVCILDKKISYEIFNRFGDGGKNLKRLNENKMEKKLSYFLLLGFEQFPSGLSGGGNRVKESSTL